jgi:hypothetical protein
MTPPPAPAKANTGAIIAFVCVVVVAIAAVVVTLVLVNGSGSDSGDGGGAPNTPGGTAASGEEVAQVVADAINDNDPDAINDVVCDSEAARRIRPLITSLEKTEPKATVVNHTQANGTGTANVSVANIDGAVAIAIDTKPKGDGWCAADGTAEVNFDGAGGSAPISAEWARIVGDDDEPAIERIACDETAAAELRGNLSSLAQVDSTATVGATEVLTDTGMRAEILTSHVGPTGDTQSATYLLELTKKPDGAWCAKSISLP